MTMSTEGDFVKVAGAQNEAEGEFLQDLLLAADVPSALRRSRGFDVPDFLSAGPRDVLVPASAVPVAREVLLEADVAPPAPEPETTGAPLRILASVLAGLALLTLIAWLGTELLA